MPDTFSVLLLAGARAGEGFVRNALPDAHVASVEEGSAELRNAIVDADAAVGARLTADELALARRLCLVQVLGAGYDEIAVDALPPGCVLCNVFLHEVAIAEWALMAMLALTHRLIVYDRDLRQGIWHDAYRFEGTPTPDLRGRTVGTVGLGNIGAEVVRLGRSLGMKAIAVTRKPKPDRERGLKLSWLGGLEALPQLFREADFVVIALPLNHETKGIIRERELRELGPNGYLINVCRGPVVDEAALYEALASRTIAGAGIDVWYRYPSRPDEVVLPASLPFWELDNVVMTPHTSGFAESTFTRRWDFIAQQLRRLADQQPLENVVLTG
jgi:phosphoglycerate dehydrogenase-like enzyme